MALLRIKLRGLTRTEASTARLTVQLVTPAFIAFLLNPTEGIVRLNSDGNIGNAFNPVLDANSSAINAIALQPDGKILIGGFFATVNGTSRTSVARLNSDGSLDATFNVMLGVNSTVRSIPVQTDGKIMLGGSFSGVNGFSRGNLVRLNADGSLDQTLNAGSISPVSQIEVQADGKYLVLANTLLRLNNNGTSDSSFQTQAFSDGSILSFVLQTDGSIIIGGSFTTSAIFRSKPARLRTDGSLDPAFIPNGADNTVRIIV